MKYILACLISFSAVAGMQLMEPTIKITPHACTGGHEATVVSVYDGDTVRADVVIDLAGPPIRTSLLGETVSAQSMIRITLVNVSLRLEGIDAPEIRGSEREEGILSRDALRRRILDRKVVVSAVERGKYGRPIATICLGTEEVNTWMVDEGHAVRRDY